MQDGETLVSSDGTFEVGFFTPTDSTNRYLGLWFKNVTPFTLVWVANRDTPLHQNSTPILKINPNGVLVLLNGTKTTDTIVWSSSNVTEKEVNNPIARVLDSGNFVVQNRNDSNKDEFLWQSFDYPSDTLLLNGMKLGWNLVTGHEIFLSSWKKNDDPSQGEYSLRVYNLGYPQVFKCKGFEKKYRIGSWNGVGFSGYQNRIVTNRYRFQFVFDEKQVYIQTEILKNLSIISTYKLTPLGHGQLSIWTRKTRNWTVISTGEEDECENYSLCGSYSICNMYRNVPICECMKGFVPKFPQEWNVSHYSNGCIPKNKSDCENSYKDGFLKYSGMKLPDTSLSWFSKTMNLEECRHSCLQNCSCSAFANLDIRNGGSGCLLWFNEIVDVRKFSNLGQDLYVRVPPSQLDHEVINNSGNKKLVGIIVGVISFGLASSVCIMIYINRGKSHYENVFKREDTDPQTFDLQIIAQATGNFSSSNKLGEGGFGPVYKGILKSGQVFAVKRLSNKSGQGLEEFRNEMAVIAKLQHRNLVKLLGYCIQGEEIMLIYEYMPNKSLDNFIFDENKRMTLGWTKRFNIITGIARGLLYLHRDSRLRIIHRDLKPSNILLDANLDPKISDFGLVRTLFGDQVEANTARVAGTYGYMPPEYAVRGRFSMKSDVFSFGVTVLEIVSGRKNREFSDPEHSHNLLGHAWRLWSEGRQLEVLDEMLWEICTTSEVMRCIQVGLLCVQQRPQDRPDMTSVLLMLDGGKIVPKPKVPSFYIERDVTSEDALLSNKMSITALEAR